MPSILGIEAETSAVAGAAHPRDAVPCRVPARVRTCWTGPDYLLRRL